MSGMFEVLAAAPDEERLARQAAQDKLAEAIYDVREELGPFLFASRDIREFRDRVALIKGDIMQVVGRHLPPVTGVMGRIVTRRGSVLEKEFKSRQSMRKGAPFADYDDFADCTSKNSDKEDSSAYCGEIKHRVEDKHGFMSQLRSAGLASTGENWAVAQELRRLSSREDSMGADDFRAEGYARSGSNQTHQGWSSATQGIHQAHLLAAQAQSDRLARWLVRGLWDLGPKASVGEPCGQLSWRTAGRGDGTGVVPSGAQILRAAKALRLALSELSDAVRVRDRQEVVARLESRLADAGLIKHQVEDGKEARVGFYPPQSHDDIVRPGQEDPEVRKRWEGLPPPGQLAPPMTEDEKWYKRATGDGPPLDTDATFEDHQGEELIPEGNFPKYLDSVDQGARSKIDDNFVDNPKGQEHTEAVTASKVTRQFVAFCRRHHLPVGLSTLERHGKKMADRDYLAVAADLQRLGWDDPFEHHDSVRPKRDEQEERPGPKEPDYFHPGKYPYAAKHGAQDFLQKATDALTGYLTQQGEQFQETIAPYQQMLQTIQQSQALQQAQSPTGDPLGVTLPGGVNVLPQAPGGAAGGQQPPLPDPSGGADPGAMPPDPTGDPGQTLARRGGHPKGEPRSGGVIDEFQHYMDRTPGLGRGGDPDVEEFANTHQVGDRAKQKLRQHLLTPGVTASVRRQAWMGWGPSVIDPPMSKVAGWEWNRELEAYVANSARKFACTHCGNQLDMPGYHTCKCGSIWNGYDIDNGGSHHEASGPTYLVREIPVRPDVIVAAAESIGVPSSYGGGSIGSPDALNDDEWPGEHHPKQPYTPAAPPDWARRDHKNNYAPQQLKKRRR